MSYAGFHGATLARELAEQPQFRKVVEAIGPAAVGVAVGHATGSRELGQLASGAASVAKEAVIHTVATGATAVVCTAASVILLPVFVAGMVYLAADAICGSAKE
jgi:hypothetical protein